MYQLNAQSGRRVLITGANSGLGKEAALRFAAAGAEVVMAVRTLAKGEAARAEIASAIPRARVDLLQLDLSKVAAVREGATRLLQEDRPIDLLVNNAGVMARAIEKHLASFCIAALTALAGGLVTGGAGLVAAETVRTLTGAQIRKAFTDKQLTDEVHYRFVYDSDGTLRSYAMGVKQVGTWRVEKNELCHFLKDAEDSCYRVTQSGERFELKPTGLGGPLDGILQPAYRGQGDK